MFSDSAFLMLSALILFLINFTQKVLLPLYAFLFDSKRPPLSDYQSGHYCLVKAQIMNIRATMEKLDVDLLVESKHSE